MLFQNFNFWNRLNYLRKIIKNQLEIMPKKLYTAYLGIAYLYIAYFRLKLPVSKRRG